jgi:hypothetical protein
VRTIATRGLLVLDARQAHVEAHAEAELPLGVHRQVHLAVDGHLAELQALAPRDRAERALEAGRVADGEQLLGVGPAVVGARRAQLDLELPVVRPAVPGDAPPR